jgi:hypothetical protein
MPRLSSIVDKLLTIRLKASGGLSAGSGFVILGNDGGIPSVITYSAYSPNAQDWTANTLPVINARWGTVAYGNGRFIAVRIQQTTNVSAYSDDGGETWTQRNLPSSPAITPGVIRYANGTWIVTCQGEATGFTSSDDGVSWTSRTLAATNGQFLDLAYGSSNWVSVEYGFTGRTRAIYSSDNGATWSASTLPASQQWDRIAYGNGRFLAVARGTSSNTVTNQAAYSLDEGVTWTATTLPSSQNWSAVAYGAGRFVVLCNGSVTATSTDAITWSPGTISSNPTWERLLFKDNLFVAIGNQTNVVAISSDGLTWTNYTLPATAEWKGIG